MKSILFIHQSAELYGSDKTILMFISGMDKTKYFPVVVLPFDGPLKTEMEKNGIKVVLAPVLKLYRKMFTPGNLWAFFKEYRIGMRVLKNLHEEHDFKLVYSHTLAALIGLAFARKHKIKHLWHVQEILQYPRVVNRIFDKLLSLKCNHKAIYDSKETMLFWIKDNPGLAAKSDFIWNGFDVSEKPQYTSEEISAIRHDWFKVDERKIVIGLVGRINSWKGQQLLLQAFKILASKYPDAQLVYLGSAPPNQDFFVTDLGDKIDEFQLTNRVAIIPFQNNIWPFWDSLDIAVVPSTEPEPFGMVVIEAMLSKKPVVASNHGGPTEIVLCGETGFLFEPNNPDALAADIAKLLDDPKLRESMGENGYRRAVSHFSLKSHIAQFEKVFSELI